MNQLEESRGRPVEKAAHYGSQAERDVSPDAERFNTALQTHNDRMSRDAAAISTTRNPRHDYEGGPTKTAVWVDVGGQGQAQMRYKPSGDVYRVGGIPPQDGAPRMPQHLGGPPPMREASRWEKVKTPGHTGDWMEISCEAPRFCPGRDSHLGRISRDDLSSQAAQGDVVDGRTENNMGSFSDRGGKQGSSYWEYAAGEGISERDEARISEKCYEGPRLHPGTRTRLARDEKMGSSNSGTRLIRPR